MSKDLGQLKERLFELKQKKTDFNAEIKHLNGMIKLVEIELLTEMQEQKLLKIGDENGTVYITNQVAPKVVNWDAFYEYIRENDYFHLLERRPSRPAFRESYELGQAIPGVDPVLFDEVRTRKS